MKDAINNKRGDKVEISTEVFDNRLTPERTVIRIERAHHWFWITLVTIDSFGIHEDMSWHNDDTLDIKLDFGCIVQIKDLKDRIGPIRILYRFTDYNREHARKSSHRDNPLMPDPDQLCPASC